VRWHFSFPTINVNVAELPSHDAALARAQEQLASWVKDEEVSDAVFRIIATIPMEWVGHTEREGLPFDIEQFFSRLREDSVQNG
jgi:hypothetical protein